MRKNSKSKGPEAGEPGAIREEQEGLCGGGQGEGKDVLDQEEGVVLRQGRPSEGTQSLRRAFISLWTFYGKSKRQQREPSGQPRIPTSWPQLLVHLTSMIPAPTRSASLCDFEANHRHHVTSTSSGFGPIAGTPKRDGQ